MIPIAALHARTPLPIHPLSQIVNISHISSFLGLTDHLFYQLALAHHNLTENFIIDDTDAPSIALENGKYISISFKTLKRKIYFFK